MKRFGFIVVAIFLSFNLSAQRNLSVSIDNPVYKVLESLQVRGLCKNLPKAKPYSHAVIVSALKSSLDKEDKLYTMEKDIILHYIDELEKTIDYKWYQTGSYRYDNKKEEEPKEDFEVTAEVGLNWQTKFNVDCVSGNMGTDNYATAYILGDISKYFSFYFDIAGGVVLYQPLAYEPFLYKKSWTGNVVPIVKDMNNNFEAMPEKISGVYNVNPELSFSFWDNKVNLRFARVNRDWGIGKGGLMLSYDAIPFSAFDFNINPVNWFNVSVITGWLESELKGNDFTHPEKFQNMYAGSAVEFFISKYAYISAFTSAVFLKRSEGMYSFPGTMGSVTQQTIGDFDNLQVGASLGFKYPGYFDIYLTMYFDEFSPTTFEAFLHKDRNMFATQVGFNFEIPQIPFTTLNLQYTKIEPYMYTHPHIARAPFYDKPMSQHYINAGQNLGYYLQPNSDELKITLETQPYWFFNAKFKYSMVRHGVDVDGSNLFGKPLNYGVNLLTTPEYNKNFLKDGVYEWFHTLGLQGEVDLKFINPAVPIKLGLGYYFVYKYHTSWEGGEIPVGEAEASETPSKMKGGKMIYVNDAVYNDSQQHIFSISFRLY